MHVQVNGAVLDFPHGVARLARAHRLPGFLAIVRDGEGQCLRVLRRGSVRVDNGRGIACQEKREKVNALQRLKTNRRFVLERP